MWYQLGTNSVSQEGRRIFKSTEKKMIAFLDYSERKCDILFNSILKIEKLKIPPNTQNKNMNREIQI